MVYVLHCMNCHGTEANVSACGSAAALQGAADWSSASANCCLHTCKSRCTPARATWWKWDSQPELCTSLARASLPAAGLPKVMHLTCTVIQLSVSFDAHS